MNKARRKNNRRSAIKKLVRESLLLSFTRSVSSRVVRFFQVGGASAGLKSVKKIDRFAKKKITAPIIQKTELRKNFTMPARNAIASFCANNGFMKGLSALRISVLNASVRTAGVFLFTFGIYAAAMIFLRRFIDLPIGEASADDLIFSGLMVIAGLLLATFGEKSNIETLGNGKIMGALLSGVLGVNDSSLDKIPQQPKSGMGIGFLLGSASGVLTAFFSPISIILTVVTVLVMASIICIPEFGLLLTVATLAILPLRWVTVIAVATFASYVIKCLRLKRNFRCGTADVLMLLSLLLIPIFGVSFQGGAEKGGGYLLLGMTLYFVAKNLISTKRLLLQTFNALCLGSFCGMVIYIFGELAPALPNPQLQSVARLLSRNAMDVDVLAVLVAISLPFALSSFSTHGTQQRNLIFLIVAVICAFVSGSLNFYLMLTISAVLFVAMSYKAPVGAAVSGAVSLPIILGYENIISHSTVVSLFASRGFDNVFNLSWDISATNFWGGFYSLNGAAPTILCALAILLSLQRVLATTILKRSESTTLLAGTVASGAMMLVACMFCFNLFADLRIVAVAWFILGLCGSVYKVLYETDKEEA